MTNVGRSEAYIKGMRAKSYVNPYERGSDEYNDFERGWSQRLKRGGSCTFPHSGSDLKQPLPLSARYSPPKAERKSANFSKYSSYADAKGK